MPEKYPAEANHQIKGNESVHFAPSTGSYEIFFYRLSVGGVCVLLVTVPSISWSCPTDLWTPASLAVQCRDSIKHWGQGCVKSIRFTLFLAISVVKSMWIFGGFIFLLQLFFFASGYKIGKTYRGTCLTGLVCPQSCPNLYLWLIDECIITY